MAKGQYYLGRVLKLNLDQEKLMNAIANSPTIQIGKFDWTITDVLDERASEAPFVFGKLSKYALDGHVRVVDERQRAQVDSDVPNLVEASSPFVYLPDLSGIVFLHVWNGIQQEVFPRRFKAIIEAAYDNFFVGCEVEVISDYRKFTSRLSELDTLSEISATVFPPNPLFGRLWTGLNDYIKERNASEIQVKEQSNKKEGINSDVILLMKEIMNDPGFQPEVTPAIGDAAILMSADGYGRGQVKGQVGEEEVTIKTSDSKKSFTYIKEPEPQGLAKIARANLELVSSERDMKH